MNETTRKITLARQQKLDAFTERLFKSAKCSASADSDAIKKQTGSVINNKKDALTERLTKSKPTIKPSNSVEIEQLKKEIAELKAENRNMKTISALEKSGCIKPDLVLKAVPDNCENLQDWIDTYKSENEMLFKQPAQKHGGNFKPTNCRNLSPTEVMNNFIRGIY